MPSPTIRAFWVEPVKKSTLYLVVKIAKTEFSDFVSSFQRSLDGERSQRWNDNDGWEDSDDSWTPAPSDYNQNRKTVERRQVK